MENFKDIYASKWDLVYDEENHGENANNRIPWFKKMIDGLDCRKELFFIVDCENKGNKEVFGFFINNNSFEKKNFTMPTYSINISHSKPNFLFKYTEEEHLHY
jgi:hypothetical protein